MEFLVASAIGILVASGVFLLLRSRTFDVVLGLTLLGYGVNLFILAMGRLAVGRPPIVAGAAATLAQHADPLPQALVLTAIVIGFAMTALLLAVALADHVGENTDHVDGEPGEERWRRAGGEGAIAPMPPSSAEPRKFRLPLWQRGNKGDFSTAVAAMAADKSPPTPLLQRGGSEAAGAWEAHDRPAGGDGKS